MSDQWPTSMPENFPEVPTSLPNMPEMPVSPEFLDRLIEAGKSIGQLQTPPPPTWEETFTYLQSAPWYLLLCLLLLGILYLALGTRFYKLLISLNAAAIGAVLGGIIAVRCNQPQAAPIIMGVGAGVLGILAWPLIKFAVAMIGSLAGASAGFFVFETAVRTTGREDLLGYSWVGSIIGAILMVILAIWVFKLAVMLVTTLQGATMFASGCLGAVLQIKGTGEKLRDILLERPDYLLISILALAIVGLVFQVISRSRHKNQNTKPKETQNDLTKPVC